MPLHAGGQPPAGHNPQMPLHNHCHCYITAPPPLAATERHGPGRTHLSTPKFMWHHQAARHSLSKMLKISTHCNLADTGTKPLELKIFLELRRALGLILEVPLPTQRSPQGIFSQVGMSKEEIVNETTIDVESMVQSVSREGSKVDAVLRLIDLLDARGR